MAETTFADLQLSEGMLKTVADLGYEAPTPIQEQTISLLIEGRDVIASSMHPFATGSRYNLISAPHLKPYTSRLVSIIPHLLIS